MQVVVAKSQHITLKQFLPAIGIPETRVRSWSPTIDDPQISVEFFISYRFGHDMIPDRIGPIDVVELFDAERFYNVTSAYGVDDTAVANAALDGILQVCCPSCACLPWASCVCCPSCFPQAWPCPCCCPHCQSSRQPFPAAVLMVIVSAVVKLSLLLSESCGAAVSLPAVPSLTQPLRRSSRCAFL